MIFAPGTPEQAFRLVNKAFDLTEKYQVPALILTDQLFADSAWSFDGIDLGIFGYKDYRLRGDDFKALLSTVGMPSRRPVFPARHPGRRAVPCRHGFR